MKESTPSKMPPGSANRQGSMSRSLRLSGGSGSMFQRSGGSDSFRKSRVTSFRASQPSYNLFTGAEAAVPSPTRHARQPSRQSTAGAESLRATSRESSKENLAPPDAEEYETQRKRIEELKAEISTLQYRIQNDEQEKEMAALQHEDQLRDVRRKAEDDFKQKQAAESDRNNTQRQYERMLAELNEVKQKSAEERAALEKKARDADDEARLIKDQLEELSAAKEEGERMNQKRVSDLEAEIASMRQTAQEFEQDTQARDALLQQTQEQLTEKDRRIGDLEADVLRLKAQTGDAETIAVIRRELTDQVQHIRTLEARNAKQHSELTHLRQIHKAVEVVEEEKRSLQRKLDAAAALEAELAEVRMQRQRLEDERLAWTAYLQSEASDGMMEFDSPEAVARALVQERYTSASLTERLGEVQPQIAERDEIIRSLEQDKSALSAQIEKIRAAGAPVAAGRAQARLERQRQLAIKEVEYLRAQLKTFDAEDETFDAERYDRQKADRIAELEGLVDQYKAEVQALHGELAAAESSTSTSTSTPPEPAVGSKRPRSSVEGPDGDGSGESEQLGELNRKRRKLADDLARLQAEHALLRKEHEVARSRLAAAEAASRTRVLSLRSNPTSDFEAVKRATLDALQRENRDLLAQVQRLQAGRKGSAPSSSTALVPASQLDAARREVEEARQATASAEKRARRLKEVWALKSQEFKEAIFSTLGWTVTFIPNGKMRVESLFYPSRGGGGEDGDGDEHENSIVFDGERGTMKVSGGPQSPFARRIADQIQFWVRDKGCIPGFLAALTLEFYEEQHARAAGR